MSGQFEYEERYAVSDPASTRLALEDFGFTLKGNETQTDHWFIPNYIMSPTEQAQWFDYDKGYALRLREQSSGDHLRVFITSKQLLRPADHSVMINNEADLTAEGMRRTLVPIGSEFDEVIQKLTAYSNEYPLSLDEAKNLIENAGRKDYIVIHKQRSTFLHAELPEIVADLDNIPALEDTDLGFSACIELEYKGPGSPDEAKKAVRGISSQLGYKQEKILAMALPGLAIKYLAVF